MTAASELRRIWRYRISYAVRDGRLVSEAIRSTLIVTPVGDDLRMIAEVADA